MEGEDAPGGFLFFKAIDARGSQTASRTTSKTNSNGATKGGSRRGGVAKIFRREIGFIFKTAAQVTEAQGPQFHSNGAFVRFNND